MRNNPSPFWPVPCSPRQGFCFSSYFFGADSSSHGPAWGLRKRSWGWSMGFVSGVSRYVAFHQQQVWPRLFFSCTWCGRSPPVQGPQQGHGRVCKKVLSGAQSKQKGHCLSWKYQSRKGCQRQTAVPLQKYKGLCFQPSTSKSLRCYL